MYLRRHTYLQRLRRYPPILVRLLTTRGNPPWCLTDQQLSDASGLTLAKVKWISWSLSWVGIPLDEHFSFMAGCDIDLENRRTLRRLEWMRRSGFFSHLRKSELWEIQFKEMAELWIESVERGTNSP